MNNAPNLELSLLARQWGATAVPFGEPSAEAWLETPQNQRALALLDAGQSDAALKAFDEAAGAWENLRSLPADPTWRERLSNDNAGLFSRGTVAFLTRFGKKPMHLFGALGSLMFVVGLGMAIYLGIDKLIALIKHVPQRLIADSAFFYIGLTSMIIGTLLFIGGFLGELVSRNSAERNKYEVEKEI